MLVCVHETEGYRKKQKLTTERVREIKRHWGPRGSACVFQEALGKPKEKD